MSASQNDQYCARLATDYLNDLKRATGYSQGINDATNIGSTLHAAAEKAPDAQMLGQLAAQNFYECKARLKSAPARQGTNGK